MKYISISPYDTLSELTERFGLQNVNQILADNNLQRTPNVGQQWAKKVKDVIQTSESVSSTRKVAILSQFVNNSDIYENAALADENTWKTLSQLNSFPDYLYISDQIENQIPNSYQVLGNGISISSSVRETVEQAILSNPPEDIDSNIFSSVNDIRDVGIATSRSNGSTTSNPMNWFNIPLDKVSLYSSITGENVYIPTYPENYNDERIANYTTMPDLLYQYEPWQMYQSSGPRSNTIDFHLHRDMWGGDHTDGAANTLIRFCQAQVYPVYNGSAVVAPTVTLYVSGSPLITGVMTNVGVDWTGPIGHDGWYLEFTLSLTIVEVSATELNHTTMLSKSLIG